MLDKAIAHGKEKRKPYRRAKAVDRACRNHGSCPYCANNRVFKMKLGKGRVAYETAQESN
jgi:hypothetical protein